MANLSAYMVSKHRCEARASKNRSRGGTNAAPTSSGRVRHHDV